MVTVVNMIPRSLSGEANQDSEPTLAVNPANPQQLVGTAFTPDPTGSGQAPIYISSDGGMTWLLNFIVPSQAQTADITVAFGSASNTLYAGIIVMPVVNNTPRLNILRTTNFQSPTTMTVLVDRLGRGVDQPYVQAITVGGKDRVYVGDNDFNALPQTATLDVSVNGQAASPGFGQARIEARGTGSAGQDGPSIRPAVHADGTVYAAFVGWRAATATAAITADIVVVRDDNGGVGAAPFTALQDGDGQPGRRIVQGIKFNFNGVIGQQRVGGDVAIAVDPTNSATVYLAYADLQGKVYTLHVRSSTDRGATWSANDLRTIPNATNPALAINSAGKVAFLYQELAGKGASQRWVTHVQQTTDGVNWNDLILATVPAANPPRQFHPYIGDYEHLLAVGTDFYGIFSASNIPDQANFPNGVTYQRNADFTTHTLLALDSSTHVPVSIDPFFFTVPG